MSDALMQSILDKDEEATKELFDYVLGNIIDMVSDFSDSEYLMDYVQECNFNCCLIYSWPRICK